MTAKPHTQKIALVTGAGSGIGRHVAVGLMQAGYAVVLSGRRREALEQTAALAAGARSLVVPGDVTDPAQVQALFDQARSTFGRLDLLFNNAGVFSAAHSIEDVPFDTWKNSVDTNLTGVFLCTQQAFRIMKDQSPRGGRIINNGSISAYAPRPWSAPYTATKHAVRGLTLATSLDGRRHDIACGQIDIGNAATDMTHQMEQGMLQANGSIAPEPTMHVDNVVKAVLYMAGLALEANVQFMTVMATKMPFVGRG